MIKKGDFVEIEYKGYAPDLFDEGKVIICVGEKWIVPGLDRLLEGKKEGEYEIELEPKDAFGERDPKKVRIIPYSEFKKHKLNPRVGMVIDVDGEIGIIKSVTSGRVFVDFNHPLSGKKVKYSIKIIRKVENEKEIIEAILKHYGIKDYKIENNKIILREKNLKEIIEREIRKHIKNWNGECLVEGDKSG